MKAEMQADGKPALLEALSVFGCFGSVSVVVTESAVETVADVVIGLIDYEVH